MCDVFECKTYFTLFRERVIKHKIAIAALCALGVLSFFVGATLILVSLILGDRKQDFWMEIIKTGIGLILSVTSLVFAKEILDRWLSLIPFSTVNKELANCDRLPPDELEVICDLAKKFLDKL